MKKNSKKGEESVLTAIFVYSPIIFLIPGLTIFICLGILGWQIFSYLSSGVWQSINSIDALSLLFQSTKFGLWLEKTDSWLGVYELISWMPLWLGVAITGVFIEIVWLQLANILLSDPDNN